MRFKKCLVTQGLDYHLVTMVNINIIIKLSSESVIFLTVARIPQAVKTLKTNFLLRTVSSKQKNIRSQFVLKGGKS